MSKQHHIVREAAAALLRLAKITSDPQVAAKLVARAADLKDQTDEMPPLLSDLAPPDVQTKKLTN